MRDINLEDTIYPKFTTRAFATGIPTTLAGTPVLSIYEENNLTQITAGVSITVDYDSVTGLNQATIVATAANGYEAGKSYDLAITTGTVGGVSVVGEVVASFTIEDSAAAVDLANTTDGLSAISSQISSLAAAPGVGARPFVPTTITVTSGTGGSGTAADLANDDANIYSVNDNAGTLTLDLDYQLDPDVIIIQANFLAAAQGVSDDLTLQFYDQVGLTYDTIDTITGANSLGYNQFDKVVVGKYTTDAGLFQVRITGTGLSSATLSLNVAVAYGQSRAAGIANGSTLTLAATTNNENFTGHNWNLALGTQDIGGSYFAGCKNVTGIGTAANGSPYKFENITRINATLTSEGLIRESGITALTFTSSADAVADELNIRSNFSVVSGAGSPTLTWAAVTKETSINVRGWHGGGTWIFTSDCTASIEVEEGGTHTVTTGGGDVEFRGMAKALVLVTSGTSTTNAIATVGPISISGTGGTVNIYGMHGAITDTSTGTAVNDLGFDTADIATILARGITTQADLDIITGADGVNLLTATQASIDATEADTNELQADDVPGLIAALNDPTAAAIATAVAAYDMGNGRTIEESLAFLRNKWTLIAGTLTVYDTDDTTVLWTSTVTQTAGDPVSASDPA
ncbi:MAG: hypothetical protein ABUJ92_00320 [Desulfobacterales bacterium]